VVNLSTTGAYLLTEESWKPGEILSLTLQRAGALEESSRRRFTVQAKLIRRDQRGVGVAFLMPRGADLRLWQSAIKAEVPQTEPEDIVREFRLAVAIAFLQQVAPDASEETNLLFREGLSNYRLESAIEISLHAQDLLALYENSGDLRADPTVVLRVLDDGAWAEMEWIQHYWAGILSTACGEGTADKSHLKFVDLLSQLTTIQARIFTASCVRSIKFAVVNGGVSAQPLTLCARELVQIADTHDLVHIERDVQHLVGLGLIDESVKWKFFTLLDEAVVTPTALGLELYARCNGHRGDPAGFFGVNAQRVATASVNQ
jgi:hypothetical protein